MEQVRTQQFEDAANAQAAELMNSNRKSDTAAASQWQGFDKIDFKVGGRAALLGQTQGPRSGQAVDLAPIVDFILRACQ